MKPQISQIYKKDIKHKKPIPLPNEAIERQRYIDHVVGEGRQVMDISKDALVYFHHRSGNEVTFQVYPIKIIDEKEAYSILSNI